MNPKPLSRTSRLIVPPGIHVSLGARVPMEQFQLSLQFNFHSIAKP
jgi:hypothetical protein